MVQMGASDAEVVEGPAARPDGVRDEADDDEGQQEGDQQPEGLLLAGVNQVALVGGVEVVGQAGEHRRSAAAGQHRLRPGPAVARHTAP